jgi:hypothetical protein
VVGIRRDPGRQRDGSAVVTFSGREPRENRLRDRERLALVAARKKKGELVAAEAERFAALPQPRRDVGEDAVADRVAVPVVDLLEVVDVD